jgi:hypothetical protein
MKRYKSPSSEQIPAEMIQRGCETFVSAIHKLINSIWNKEELPDQWKESIILPIHKKFIKLTVITIVGYKAINAVQKFNYHSSFKFNSMHR